MRLWENGRLATFILAWAVGSPALSAATAPSITSQPLSQTVDSDTAYVNFSVTASGTPPFTYQWSKNGAAIAGATNDLYTIVNVQTYDAGSYVVVVLNSVGSATSSAATFAVNPPPAVSEPWSFGTLAGLAGVDGSADGIGSAARFRYPAGIALDSTGNIYVADSGSHTIRMITSTGVVRTLAGQADSLGSADGTGNAARFSGPDGLAVDGAGNVYVADSGNHTIRRITPTGVVTTLAGQAGSLGSADGTGSVARFSQPNGVAVDSAGNVYVADQNNHAIRKITPDAVVTTLAGQAGRSGSSDRTGNVARLNSPYGVAVDGAGNVYVADTRNETIRKVTQAGVVTTLAGLASNTGSSAGSADGTGSAARFYTPLGVAVDGTGNVYVTDSGNHTIRKITAAGVVTTLAGLAGSLGNADGTGSAARFKYPHGVGVDIAGNVYVTDNGNYKILKVTSAGVVTTLAGSSGGADGTGSAASFNNPQGVAVDSAGNVYVADSGNNTVRNITPTAVVGTLAGLGGNTGNADGIGSTARFKGPVGLAVENVGNVYVADSGNHTIRKITPAGMVTTLAGLAGSSGSTDGIGSAARFNSPSGLAVDSAGNIIVADQENHTIRKITPKGEVTTLAGRAGSAFSRDGIGSTALFWSPKGIAVNGEDNVYVADYGNCTIRRITPTGMVTTLAGTPRSGANTGSTDGIGSAARFKFPTGIAVDGAGNIFVADQGNQTIRKITPGGLVTTLGGRTGLYGSLDGIGSAAKFSNPSGIGVDSSGTIYIADSLNNTIRVGRPATTPVVPPSMRAFRSANQVTISWPVSATGFVLESTTNLTSGTSWISIRTGITTIGDQSVFPKELTAGAAFFRLKKP